MNHQSCLEKIETLTFDQLYQDWDFLCLSLKQNLLGHMVTLLIYLLTVLAGRNLIAILSEMIASDIFEVIIVSFIFYDTFVSP